MVKEGKSACTIDMSEGIRYNETVFSRTKKKKGLREKGLLGVPSEGVR